MTREQALEIVTTIFTSYPAIVGPTKDQLLLINDLSEELIVQTSKAFDAGREAGPIEA